MALEGYTVEEDKGVPRITDSDGRKYWLVNQDEWDIARYPGRGRGSGLWCIWFDQHAPTRILVWSRRLGDALEEAAQFVKEHWPGNFLDENELFEDAKRELGPDATEEDLIEHAEMDTTRTESGLLNSDDWGYCFSPGDEPDLEDLARRIAPSYEEHFREEIRDVLDGVDAVSAEGEEITDYAPLYLAVVAILGGREAGGITIDWTGSRVSRARAERVIAGTPMWITEKLTNEAMTDELNL